MLQLIPKDKFAGGLSKTKIKLGSRVTEQSKIMLYFSTWAMALNRQIPEMILDVKRWGWMRNENTLTPRLMTLPEAS